MFDENFKQFNEIYLTYLDDSLNTNDSLNLILLGNKCPLLDGSVVYQARAMYGALFGYKYIFTDGCPKYGDDNEKSLVQNENVSTQIFEENEIAVYPNPNNGKFYIKTMDIKFIQIFDLQGRVIQFSQNKIADQTFEIEIEAENGMYNVQVINDNTIQNVKIKVFN